MTARIWLCALSMTMIFPVAGSAQGVPSSPTDVHPLLIGATVPDANLRGIDDEQTTLHAALGDSRAVLVFYRGGW